MTVIDIILLAVALSMDAFAVAVCKGLAMKQLNMRGAVTVGLWFGGFQALMPAAGYLLGQAFQRYIRTYVPWIAFVLLSLIGANMIKEAVSRKQDEGANASLSFSVMLPLAVATSIDALATGVTFVMIEPASVVWLAVALIGIITFCLSALGVKIGHVFGTKYRSRAELAGGLILVLLGVKILLSHYGVLPF